MARSVRGGNLETRSARLRLAARPKPYYVLSAKPGIHLGYRRLAGVNGRWILRRYIGAQDYPTAVCAQADDHSDADGTDVLTYHQAMQQVGGEAAAIRVGGGLTVGAAAQLYV